MASGLALALFVRFFCAPAFRSCCLPPPAAAEASRFRVSGVSLLFHRCACLLFGLASDFSDFSGKPGNRFTGYLWREALLPSFVQSASGYAFCNILAAFEQFLAFLFCCFNHLIGALSQKLVLTACMGKKHPNEGAERGETESYS